MSLTEKYRALSGGVVSINVGATSTPFDAHIELLCDCSPYFNKVFNDRLDDRTPEPVRLPDDDPDAFTEFLNWAYRGTIFQSRPSPSWIDLCRLWVLAGKFEISKLQNLVVTHCKNKYSTESGLVAKDAVEYVYDHAIPGSPLRQMVVDIWV